MELRLILLLIGAVIIAAVWLFSRPRKPADDKLPPRAVPSFDEGFPEDDLPSKTVPGASAKTAPIKQQGAQLILALHVMPRAAEHFTGTELKSAFEACLLKYGRYKVFHRLEGASDDASVFSVANVVEPGSFELTDFPEASFPGLTLFMVLPGPRGGVAAYADMLATARRLAQLLGGEVLDQERSTLTRQTARHIRERIIQFELQQRLKHPS